MTLSNRMNNPGVRNIEIATTSARVCESSNGITWFCTEKLSNTKPNSPACAKLSVNNQRLLPLIRKVRAMTNRITAFRAITPSVRPMIKPKSLNSTEKSMPAPTVIKNRPSNRPLNGSMLDSNSWRNSLFASITPAKKVPKAGDRPTKLIKAAMPITSINAVAVKISRNPELAT